MNVHSLTRDDTGELLDRYRRQGDGEAFAELVKRHSGLVFGVAMRSLGNDAAMAEEAAQNTFIQLAQHAGRLSGDASLGGWLHRVTCRIASNLRRGETRRRLRESAMPSSDPDSSGGAWRQLAPVLDAALDRLDAADREPVILRFFENRSTRDIAIVMQLSEEAARKRIQRALEKLRRMIGKQGVALSAAALPGLLAGAVLVPLSSVRAESWAAAALTAPPVPAVMPGGAAVSRPVSGLAGAAAALLVSAPFLWSPEREHLRSPVAARAAVTKAASSVPAAPDANSAWLFEPLPGESTEDIIAAMERVARGPSHALSRWRLEAIAARVPVDFVRDLLDKARELDLAGGKSQVLRALLKRWASSDPGAALDYVARYDLDRGKGLSHAWALVTDWAQKDAKAAAQWLLTAFDAHGLQGSSIEGPVNAKLAAFVLEQLVAASPADAIAFAEKLPPGPARTAALKGLAGDDELGDFRTGWSKKQREQLADSLAEACRGPLSSEPFRRYLTRWASRDETAVSAWLQQQTDPSTRLEASLALLAIKSFEVATGPMSSTMKPVTDHEDRAAAVVGASAGILKPEEVLTRVAAAWPGNDPALVTWLTTQNPGVNADAALAQTASQMLTGLTPRMSRAQDTGPPPAFACAEKISDATLRDEMLCGLYRRWSQQNPKAAAAFLETSGWPAERTAWLKSVTAQIP